MKIRSLQLMCLVILIFFPTLSYSLPKFQLYNLKIGMTWAEVNQKFDGVLDSFKWRMNKKYGIQYGDNTRIHFSQIKFLEPIPCFFFGGPDNKGIFLEFGSTDINAAKDNYLLIQIKSAIRMIPQNMSSELFLKSLAKTYGPLKHGAWGNGKYQYMLYFHRPGPEFEPDQYSIRIIYDHIKFVKDFEFYKKGIILPGQ